MEEIQSNFFEETSESFDQAFYEDPEDRDDNDDRSDDDSDDDDGGNDGDDDDGGDDNGATFLERIAERLIDELKEPY